MSYEQSSGDSGNVDPIDEVVIIGTGFIGLPLALILADNGVSVVGVDIDENLVEAINDQSLNLNEERLDELLQRDSVQSNLRATTEPVPADAFVISVPTPLTQPEQRPDLTHVEAALDSILPVLQEGDTINVESTVPPLAFRNTVVPRLEAEGFTPGGEIMLAHSPERILPGNVFDEIINNDRIIGGYDERSARRAADIYAPFLDGKVHFTDMVSAAMVKLVENTYRDINIALSNELALVANDIDRDVDEIIRLANNHPRVDLLSPGIGVGGHCLPVDPWFLHETDPENTTLISTARKINQSMPSFVAKRIRREVSALSEPQILALGAAYKPNTHDMRNSPAQQVVEELRQDGYDVEHHDQFVDGMGYESLRTLIEEVGPDVVLQLVPHDSTLDELNEMSDWLVEKEITQLRFGGQRALGKVVD